MVVVVVVVAALVVAEATVAAVVAVPADPHLKFFASDAFTSSCQTSFTSLSPILCSCNVICFVCFCLFLFRFVFIRIPGTALAAGVPFQSVIRLGKAHPFTYLFMCFKNKIYNKI